MSNSVGNEAVVIGSKLAVDDLGELPLQATQRLPGSLVLGELSAVVILAETRVHHLHPRSEVQRVVQRAIPRTTQPMTAYVTAGGFNRGGSCIARVMTGGGETRDIPSVAKDLGREHLANPRDARQAAAAGSDGLCASLPVGCEIAVQSPHVSDELSRHALALNLHNSNGASGPEQRGSVVGCEVGRCTTWAQVSQQPVEPVDCPPALLVQFVPPVGEEPKDRRMVLTRYLAKSSAVHGDGGYRDGIQQISLPTVAGVQESRSSGKGGRDVDHSFPNADKLLGKKEAESGCTLDGPRAFWPPRRPLQEAAERGLVRGDTQLRHDLSIIPQCRCSVRALVRIDPDDDHDMHALLGVGAEWVTAKGTLSSGSVTPLSSHTAAGRRPAGTL
jgi:hypothetical protein